MFESPTGLRGLPSHQSLEASFIAGTSVKLDTEIMRKHKREAQMVCAGLTAEEMSKEKSRK